MEKQFDAWNTVKKYLQGRDRLIYAHPREIWWCSLGVNVGYEMDGKNESFERPVLVLRMYNKEMLLVLPVTSKEKNDAFHCKVRARSRDMWVTLTQIRVISNRRLLRKIDVLGSDEFVIVQNALKSFL